MPLISSSHSYKKWTLVYVMPVLHFLFKVCVFVTNLHLIGNFSKLAQLVSVALQEGWPAPAPSTLPVIRVVLLLTEIFAERV